MREYRFRGKNRNKTWFYFENIDEHNKTIICVK